MLSVCDIRTEREYANYNIAHIGVWDRDTDSWCEEREREGEREIERE